MKILLACNYYHPYVSGLSLYVKMLAERFARAGHRVGVVTSQHERDIPPAEEINGVMVIRTPVWFRISKGVVSPGYFLKVAREARRHDVANIHLPMLEAGAMAPFMDPEKLILTYHCDLNLGGSRFGSIIERTVRLSMAVAARRCRAIVTSSLDYAKTSPFLSHYIKKCIPIAPPVASLKRGRPRFRRSGFSPHIGFIGRFVREKGLDRLLKAAPLILKRYPRARFYLAGEHTAVAGGSVLDEIKPLLEKYGEHVELPGRISYSELADFYSSLDLLVLPSVNRMEAYGMVQVEAMLCGTPVVASNLPGVRRVVQQTGMGILATPGDEEDLARAICEAVEKRDELLRPRERIVEVLELGRFTEKYLEVFTGGS